jgi:ABC-type bacteriocin/lantibiotic exporter with double-glycine peptidase domain
MFIWHVLSLPVEFFAQRYAGDISKRQGSNEEMQKSFVPDNACFSECSYDSLYLAVLIYFDVLMALVGLLVP